MMKMNLKDYLNFCKQKYKIGDKFKEPRTNQIYTIKSFEIHEDSIRRSVYNDFELNLLVEEGGFACILKNNKWAKKITAHKNYRNWNIEYTQGAITCYTSNFVLRQLQSYMYGDNELYIDTEKGRTTYIFPDKIIGIDIEFGHTIRVICSSTIETEIVGNIKIPVNKIRYA